MCYLRGMFDPLRIHQRARAADRSGLQTPDGRILLALTALGPLHLPALKREVGFARSTCRTALDRLRDAERVAGYEVTEDGRRELAQILTKYRGMVARGWPYNF